MLSNGNSNVIWRNINMDAEDFSREPFASKFKFKTRSKDDQEKLLIGKDKASTQRATKSFVSQFSTFLAVKKLPKLEDLDLNDLGEILFDYYSSIQPQKTSDYSVQSLKCIRSGLNRYFKKTRGVDIISDTRFVKANEMFAAVKVDSKKKGKGVKRSYPPITQLDLERIAEYFLHDHLRNPQPRRLQQNMIFYIIYFFCRRGRENLYSMTKETFKLVITNDGTEFFEQAIDEIDKNHTADDNTKTNEGKMYATNGKYS